jgi:hypothetical protein
MIRAAALLLFAVIGAAAEIPAAVGPNVAAWTTKGYRLKDSATTDAGGMSVVVAVYEPVAGGPNRLEAYVVVDGKAFLGYSHPGQSDSLTLESFGKGRRFRDLLRDGSVIFSYRSEQPGLKTSSLEVVSYKRFKFHRTASFPEGRWVSSGNESWIMAVDLPLGRFLSVGCENFGTTSSNASRTRYFTVKDGQFVDASARRADLFKKEIQRKQGRMKELRGDLQKNAGEYLGLGLSVYYDYAALGDARAGWAKQREFFQVPGYATGPVKACFETMRRDLRGRLAIPADWP